MIITCIYVTVQLSEMAHWSRSGYYNSYFIDLAITCKFSIHRLLCIRHRTVQHRLVQTWAIARRSIYILFNKSLVTI